VKEGEFEGYDGKYSMKYEDQKTEDYYKGMATSVFNSFK